MQSIGIVGLNDLGIFLFNSLKSEFEIHVYEKNKQIYKNLPVGIIRNIKIKDNAKELFKDVKTIFYCLEPKDFEKIIADHSKYFDNHLIIDTLKVKIFPLKIFRKHINDKNYTRAILTNFIFEEKVKLIMQNHSALKEEYNFWKKLFKDKGLNVTEMDAKKHDRFYAKTYYPQYFVSSLLNEIGYESNPLSNEKLKILEDLNHYNAYSKDVRLSLNTAYEKLSEKLLPVKAGPKKLIIGIQGGQGSFNEEAINKYTKDQNLKDFKIKYLYTTENVLKSLNRGDVDYGQFALGNTLGGIVEESLQAMSKYKFRIVNEFFIPIKHFLMKHKDSDYKEIDTVMAHPQVLKECAKNLKKNYPKLKLLSGKGELVDTAKAAKALHEGKLDKSIAILGPIGISFLYDFDIIAENLQDEDKNFTTFLIVQRR